MKAEKILDCIGGIDDDLILMADRARNTANGQIKTKAFRWQSLATLTACITLLCISFLFIFQKEGNIGSSWGVMGNTPANIVNGGQLAESDGWVYYEMNGLYKIRVDGTEKTLLDSGEYRYRSINVVGDWIYYITDCIYKMRTDGTEKERLDINDKVYSASVYGDWIYLNSENILSEVNYHERMYKVRTSFTDFQVINEEKHSDMCVYDGYIYYISLETDIRTLYRMNIGSSEKEKLSDDTVGNIIISDDYIYYSNLDDDCTLYRISLNGENREKLDCDYMGRPYFVQNYPDFTVQDDWIYYKYWGEPMLSPDYNPDLSIDGYENTKYIYEENENTGLWRYNVDSGEKIRLSEAPETFLVPNITENYLRIQGTYFVYDPLYLYKWNGSDYEIEQQYIDRGTALACLGYINGTDHNVYVSTENWEITEDTSRIRDMFYGTWNIDRSNSDKHDYLIIDDSEKDNLVTGGTDGGIFYNVKDYSDTLVFISSMESVGEYYFYWTDKAYPKFIYYAKATLVEHEKYGKVFNLGKEPFIITGSKTISPLNEPENNFISRRKLREMANEYGIDFSMLVDLEYEGCVHHEWSFYNVYLVSEEENKLIFKSTLHSPSSIIDVIYTVEKIDGVWVRTISTFPDAIEKYKNSSFELKFYSHDREKDPDVLCDSEDCFKYNSQMIDADHFALQFAYYFYEYTDLKADDIWYEGNKVCIDLDKEVLQMLDMGSTGGRMYRIALLLTLSSLPDVKYIEILIDGERGIIGSHFDFSQIFDVDKMQIY